MKSADNTFDKHRHQRSNIDLQKQQEQGTNYFSCFAFRGYFFDIKIYLGYSTSLYFATVLNPIIPCPIDNAAAIMGKTVQIALFG